MQTSYNKAPKTVIALDVDHTLLQGHSHNYIQEQIDSSANLATTNNSKTTPAQTTDNSVISDYKKNKIPNVLAFNDLDGALAIFRKAQQEGNTVVLATNNSFPEFLDAMRDKLAQEAEKRGETSLGGFIRNTNIYFGLEDQIPIGRIGKNMHNVQSNPLPRKTEEEENFRRGELKKNIFREIAHTHLPVGGNFVLLDDSRANCQALSNCGLASNITTNAIQCPTNTFKGYSQIQGMQTLMQTSPSVAQQNLASQQPLSYQEIMKEDVREMLENKNAIQRDLLSRRNNADFNKLKSNLLNYFEAIQGEPNDFRNLCSILFTSGKTNEIIDNIVQSKIDQGFTSKEKETLQRIVAEGDIYKLQFPENTQDIKNLINLARVVGKDALRKNLDNSNHGEISSPGRITIATLVEKLTDDPQQNMEMISKEISKRQSMPNNNQNIPQFSGLANNASHNNQVQQSKPPIPNEHSKQSMPNNNQNIPQFSGLANNASHNNQVQQSKPPIPNEHSKQSMPNNNQNIPQFSGITNNALHNNQVHSQAQPLSQTQQSTSHAHHDKKGFLDTLKSIKNDIAKAFSGISSLKENEENKTKHQDKEKAKKENVNSSVKQLRP